MQPSAGDAGVVRPRHDLSTDPSPLPEVPVVAADIETGHDPEQLRMLLLGFGTGLTIALLFLVYILLAYGNVLP